MSEVEVEEEEKEEVVVVEEVEESKCLFTYRLHSIHLQTEYTRRSSVDWAGPPLSGEPHSMQHIRLPLFPEL